MNLLKLRNIIIVIICLFIQKNNLSATNVDSLCIGDVDNNRIVDDRDKQIIIDNFDINTDDIFDIVPMAYSYGDDCRMKVYLPIIFNDSDN